MKKRLRTALVLTAGALLCACSVTADELSGEAQGYGGRLRVLVTMDRGHLAGVQVTEHHETQGVGTRAIDALPERMAAQGTWDVDAISGATVTSEAVKAAVRQAMEDEPSQNAATPADMTTLPPGQDLLSGRGLLSRCY